MISPAYVLRDKYFAAKYFDRFIAWFYNDFDVLICIFWSYYKVFRIEIAIDPLKVYEVLIYLIAFFQTLEPLANTTFELVFLPRLAGNVENTVFIRTNRGEFTYQVHFYGYTVQASLAFPFTFRQTLQFGRTKYD